MMTTNQAISRLISMVEGGRPVHGAGADDRGGESVGGAVALRFEEGVFVLEQVDWHESNGFRDRESLTRWTCVAGAVSEVLEADRHLLKSLLRACDALRAGARPDAQGPRPALAGREAVEAMLDRVERGDEWFLLAVSPMLREEALVCQPLLGWRHLETDCARDVELESVLRSLRSLPGDPAIDARDRAAALVGAALQARPEAGTERLPAEIEAQLSSIGAQYGSALRRLDAGAWWLEDGKASGLVGGRAVTAEYDPAGIQAVVSQDAPLLAESLLASLVRRSVALFGDRPPQVQRVHEDWLDIAALTSKVRQDEVVVETYPGGWSSHDLPEWSMGRVGSRKTLKPTAVQELPAAVGGARLWRARRQGGRDDAGERALERRRAQLVAEGLALARGRPVTDASEEDRGTESVRQEHELSAREDGLFVLVQRTSRMRGGSPYQIEERRLVESESGMRGGLAGRNGDWLERAVAAPHL